MPEAPVGVVVAGVGIIRPSVGVGDACDGVIDASDGVDAASGCVINASGGGVNVSGCVATATLEVIAASGAYLLRVVDLANDAQKGVNESPRGPGARPVIGGLRDGDRR